MIDTALFGDANGCSLPTQPLCPCHRSVSTLGDRDRECASIGKNSPGPSQEVMQVRCCATLTCWLLILSPSYNIILTRYIFNIWPRSAPGRTILF